MTPFLLAAMLSVALPDPPVLVLLEDNGFITLPDGQRVSFPAGSTIGAYADNQNRTLIYSTSARTMRVLAPDATLFKDGFD